MALKESKDVIIGDCLTVGEFVKVLKKRTKNNKISNSTVHYHLTPESEMLNYVEWCGLKMIVQDDKAKDFTPGGNYAKKEEKPAENKAEKQKQDAPPKGEKRMNKMKL